MSEADKRTDITVEEYLASLDDNLQSDARKITELMQKISGNEPMLYGFGTIGYGIYHYHYESGRKGEAHTLGFYPRKGKITIYLMDGTKRYANFLTKLGKHTLTGYCIYIKHLSDIKLSVLEEILQKSYDNITAQEGKITKILWKD